MWPLILGSVVLFYLSSKAGVNILPSIIPNPFAPTPSLTPPEPVLPPVPDPVSSIDPDYVRFKEQCVHVANESGELPYFRYKNGVALNIYGQGVLTGSISGGLLPYIIAVATHNAPESAARIPYADKAILAAYGVTQKAGTFYYYGVNGSKPAPYAYLLEVHPTTIWSTVKQVFPLILDVISSIFEGTDSGDVENTLQKADADY